MIALPSRPSDLLDWNIETEETDILWRFEQGLEERGFPIEDEMRFSALALALEKFSKEIWPRFQERTAGAVLYRGRADFDSLFSWTERQRENWAVWKEERPQASEAHMKRLFCADAYVHYFQMLAHKLPDEMPIYLLLDVSGLGSEAERHQLVSRERFAHFHAAVRGLARTNGKVWNEAIEESPKPPCALVFPEEARCSGDILRKLDRAMEKIEAPFRVIGEPYLTEEWEGVDVLYILPEAVSPQGERMLKGFCAAGGTVFAVE